MRKINEIFFAGENEKGLTSSSANYLANMAGEQVAATSSLLEECNFIDTEIAIIGHQDRILSNKGMSTETFNKIPDLIKRHGLLKAFAAWIREAIKAKDQELKDAKEYSKEQWIKDQNIQIPEMQELPEYPEKPQVEDYPEKPKQPDQPESPKEVKETDVLETWTIKDRNRYFEIEAMAATYGKILHQTGAFNVARDSMHVKVASPVKSTISGRDTIVEYYAPSIPVEEVDGLFNKLQDLYRSNEKELNAMKFRIKEEMEKETQRRQSEFREQLQAYKAQVKNWEVQMDEWKKVRDEVDLRNRKATEEYNSMVDSIRKECQSIRATYSAKLGEIQSQFESYQSDLINKVSKLKIRIPESLLGIFHELDSLGK